MRTLIFLLVGVVVAIIALRFTPPSRHVLVASLFSVAWLVVAALNLRTGLAHGYTLAEELPIHLVLGGVPVAAAWLWLWWSAR